MLLPLLHSSAAVAWRRVPFSARPPRSRFFTCLGSPDRATFPGVAVPMLYAGQMQELQRPIETEAVEPEDLALEAILALRELWDSAPGGRRGVTLGALGFEAVEQC